jgi:hypothetical protein
MIRPSRQHIEADTFSVDSRVKPGYDNHASEPEVSAHGPSRARRLAVASNFGVW